MDLATGRRNRVPVAQLIRRTLKEIEPHARELGSERELEGIREILVARQRRRPPAARLQREPRHRRGRRARSRTRPRSAVPLMIGVGEQPVPEATVFAAPGEPVHARASCSPSGPALFVFYLFDWSSDLNGRAGAPA